MSVGSGVLVGVGVWVRLAVAEGGMNGVAVIVPVSLAVGVSVGGPGSAVLVAVGDGGSVAVTVAGSSVGARLITRIPAQ